MAIRTPARGFIIVAGILTLAILYTISYRYRSTLNSHNLVPSFLHSKPSQHDFVARALEHEVSDPFNIAAISNLCRNRPPRDDVIVRCNPGTGGVGNIRSYMLHCTRFAMEVGASMLLPQFHRRSKSDLFELNGDLGDFEHFFDREHYVATVHAACPHMKVYENPEEEWTMANIEIPHWPLAINVSTLTNPSPWRLEFDSWFETSTAGMKRPVNIASGDPGRDRAVMDDGIDLYYSIGRILKFRPDARRLAALCMAEINRRFNLHMDPEQNLFENAYMGAHLRTSSDAVKAGWNPDFEQQTDWYINQTLRHGLSVIFAAGGNDLDLERFANKAIKSGIDLVTKYDLLSGNDRRELDNFLWDQRGLVDFEILLKASQYGGYARSSFSHNVAFRRHFVSKVKDQWADPDNHFADEISVVYGRFDAGWEDEGVRTMWP